MQKEPNRLIIGKRQAALYPSAEADKPLIVLNEFSGDGRSVVDAMDAIGAPDCNLLVIGNLNWAHDMTPWYCPPLSENDAPCTGGAVEYLNLLLSEILPKARERIRGKPSFVGIAGYSLAGLFALYAMYRCDVFDRVASVSGSLWFPKFSEYAAEHPLLKRPEKVYLSLGDREANTRNRYLKTVQENTEAIAAYYRDLGLDVTWELNVGNHFRDAALRCAKGIKAMLESSAEVR